MKHISAIVARAALVLVIASPTADMAAPSLGGMFTHEGLSRVQSKVGTRKTLELASLLGKLQGGPADREVVEAVIWIESAWDPLAVSCVGAQGLMQVMPATAKQYWPKARKRYGLGAYNPWDPVDNVALGSIVLEEYSLRYKGDLAWTLAAYSSGPGTVQSWKSPHSRYVGLVLGQMGDVG